MSDTDPLQDPYFDTGRCVQRLFDTYLQHPDLVIAVDMDDTLFDYHKTGATYPAITGILRQCNELGFLIVVFTSSPNSRHPFIREYMASLGITIHGINTNPKPLPFGNEGKIMYNLFMDDRSGLQQAFDILRLTISRIRHHLAARAGEAVSPVPISTTS